MGNQLSTEEISNFQSMAVDSELSAAQCLAIVKVDGKAFEFMTYEMRSNYGIAKAAIQKSPMAFCNASDELRNDRGLLMAAFKTHPIVFRSASDAIKNDVPFLYELIQECHPHFLYVVVENVPPALVDREMGLAVARKCYRRCNYSNGYNHALSCLPAHILQDKQVVIEAIKTGNRMARLIHDNFQLRSDDDLVKATIQFTPSDFVYLPREMINRYDIAWFAIETNGALFMHLKEEYRADKNFLLLAMKTSTSELRHASAELQANKQIAEIALAGCGGNFYHIAEELKTHPELVKLAVSYDAKCFKWLPWKIKTHPCLQLFAILTAKCPYDRDHIINRKDFLFQFSVGRLEQVFKEKACFMMSSHVKWGPTIKDETTGELPVVVKLPIHKLNDHGKFMAFALKRRIAGYLGINMFWNTEHDVEVATFKTAHNLAKRPRLCQEATALELDLPKMKAAAIFAPMLNEACANRIKLDGTPDPTTAFKMLTYFANL